jgi:anaerobic selenocysteine-containing dehydrogenase
MFFKTGISRRWFMKLGLSGFAGLTAHKYVQGKTKPDQGLPASVSRTSLKKYQAIPTTCRQCPAGCGVIAYLDGDRLVQVLGNPDHPDNRGGLCAKGIAGINLVNDVERLLYPLKRVGPRGSSSWSRITWDEAYSILFTRLKPLISRGETHRLVVDSGSEDPLLNEFLSSLGCSNVLQRQVEKNNCGQAALASVFGLPLLEADIENSHTIFNFGANPYENHDRFVGMARRLVKARVDNGARLVTFDVRMSKTAAGSDEWIPLKAGTDGLLALALVKVILDSGQYHRDYFRKKNQGFIARLKKHVSRYTLEYTESECGVPSRVIEKLALRFATGSPAVALVGGGVTDHYNGFESARCIALLNLLVGNVGKKGGLFYPGWGSETDRIFQISKSAETRPTGFADLKTMIESKSGLDTCLIYQSNPAYSDADCLALEKVLKDEDKIPFLVVMDTHMTETALLADLVLPAATYLESWGVETRLSMERKPLINFNQPAVTLLSDAQVLRSPAFNIGKLLGRQFRPRGESREIGTLCLELSRRLGGKIAEFLPYEDTLDFVRKRIAGHEDVSRQGGIQYLKQHGYWEGEHPISLAETEVLFQRYSPVLKASSLFDLPEYQSLPNQGKKDNNVFVLTTFKPNLSAYGTANSKWVREFFHQNQLWMNAGSARKLGIKNGSRVRITSSVGSLTLRVLATERIHPDSAALATGVGHSGVGNVARGKAFKSQDRDTGLIWWGKKGNGVNPHQIIESQCAASWPGQGLKDTLITVEKI